MSPVRGLGGWGPRGGGYWQRGLSRRTRTINSMCVGTCTKTCEHVCVRLHIHPADTHTVYVCVCACTRARAIVCMCVCVCETKPKNHSQTIGHHSRVSWLRYFALLLKPKDRRSAQFLAFIRPVVQWIIQQWSFLPLVAVKCEVSTTTSTREIQLCAPPATQLTRLSPTSGKSRTPVHCACAKI